MLFAMSPINNYAYCLFLPTLLGRFPLAIGVIKTSFLKYCFLKPQIHKVNCNQPYTDIMAKFICEIVTLLLKYTQNLMYFTTVHRDDYMDLLRFSILSVP